MSDGPRYGSFTVRTECGRCGNPVPVHGPLPVVPCPSCFSDVAIDADVWRSALEELDENHDVLPSGQRRVQTWEVGGQRIRAELANELPACEKCHHPFAVDQLPADADQNFACIQCGDPASTHPIPGWLRELVPTARQYYSTEPAAGRPGTGAVPLEAENAIKPIVMACPSCGGSLSATTASERIMGCQFCQADVYLPDEVWRRLHPVPVVREWFVRFEGPTRKEKRARLEAQRQAEAAAARREQSRRDKEARARRDAAEARAISSMKTFAWVTSSLFVVGLIALIAVNWLRYRDRLPVGSIAGENLTIGLAAVALVLLIVALVFVGRPIKEATGYDTDWMIFCTWFWVPFALLMPVVGQIMALVRVFVLFRGRFGASSITTNDVSTRNYAAVRLERGEGRPAALLFLALALLHPLAVVTAVAPEEVERALAGDLDVAVPGSTTEPSGPRGLPPIKD